VKTIVGTASRDLRQSDRIMRSRYELTAYDCYEPAVELFDERCYDISQVYQSVISVVSDISLISALISVRYRITQVDFCSSWTSSSFLLNLIFHLHKFI